MERGTKFKTRTALLPRRRLNSVPMRLFGRLLTAALSLITDRNLLSSIFLSHFHRAGSLSGNAPGTLSQIARPGTVRDAD